MFRIFCLSKIVHIKLYRTILKNASKKGSIMSVIKCKMCGGDLNITTGVAVAVCDYCGSKQTIPNLDNDKKEALFTRANRLRFNCEF